MFKLGVVKFPFIYDIVIFGVAMLTVAFPPMKTPADAFMPRFPPIETFGAATLRILYGIEIFDTSIFMLGGAMLAEAFPPIPIPSDAFMLTPMSPPKKTFGAF
jgi:hypothetical protein